MWKTQGRENMWGGGQNRVDLSFCVSPCFAVFGGPKVPRCLDKQHEKCHCRAPSCVPLNASGNEDLRTVSPYTSRQSTGRMTNRPLLAHKQGKHTIKPHPKKGFGLVILLGWYRPFRAGGKNGGKMDFGPTEEMGEKWQKNGKIGRKPYF